MKILIDTHILLLWLSNDRRLSKKAKLLIMNQANTIFISAVSVWEIYLKKSLGKLDIDDKFLQYFPLDSFELLSLTARHAEVITNLECHHRDPFDRMLVAQAMVERLQLLTVDKRVAAYGDFTVLA